MRIADRILLTAAAASLAAAAVAVSAPPPTSRPAVADPRPAERKAIYFPPENSRELGRVREIRAGEAVVLTDAEKLPADHLAAHMRAVLARLAALPLTAPAATQPASRPAPEPITAAVYARQDDFRALWRRVGDRYGGRFFGIAQAGGYSYRVFCATFVDAADPGKIPSELSHEFAHVWMWRRAGLPNNGSWLSEGLATAVEMGMHTDPGRRRLWARRAGAGKYLPLKRLMSERPLAPRRYWQACTLAELLIADHRSALPAVIRAVADGRSPTHIVNTVLHTTWPDLERRWKTRVENAAP